MTGLTRLIVTAMVICLTIQQSAWAARASNASSAKTSIAQVIVSSDESGFVASDNELGGTTKPDSSSEANNAGNLRSSLQKSRLRKTFGGPAQTIVYVAPSERSVLFAAEVGGQTYSLDYSDRRGASGRSVAKGIATQLGVSYGVNDNFYLGLQGHFASMKAESRVSGYDLTNKVEGFREPDLIAGFQIANEKSRFMAEISARMPIGPSSQRSEGVESTRDHLDGGASVEPRVIGVHDLKPVRLFAQTGYRFLQERRIEDRSTLMPRNLELRGGDIFNFEAGFELPRLYHWGLKGAYVRTETSQIREEGTGAISSDPGSEAIVATTYMGLPAGRNVLLIPKLAYSTYLRAQWGDGLTVDQSSFWNFSLHGMYMF